MKNGLKTLGTWLIIGIVVIFALSAIIENSGSKMKYSELISKMKSGEVTSIDLSASGNSAEVKLKGENVSKEVNIPDLTSFMNYAENYLESEAIVLNENSESIIITILSLLSPFALLIIFLVFWMFTMGSSSQAGGKTMTFGKSKARMLNTNDKNRVTFDDVAGVDEEKEELEEIVEFLKNPKKFTQMGARIPKGVLLVGHPGTGKTLLAKAVAGEAGVPFFIISGSDFVEMFVGKT